MLLSHPLTFVLIKVDHVCNFAISSAVRTAGDQHFRRPAGNPAPQLAGPCISLVSAGCGQGNLNYGPGKAACSLQPIYMLLITRQG